MPKKDSTDFSKMDEAEAIETTQAGIYHSNDNKYDYLTTMHDDDIKDLTMDILAQLRNRDIKLEEFLLPEELVWESMQGNTVSSVIANAGLRKVTEIYDGNIDLTIDLLGSSTSNKKITSPGTGALKEADILSPDALKDDVVSVEKKISDLSYLKEALSISKEVDELRIGNDPAKFRKSQEIFNTMSNKLKEKIAAVRLAANEERETIREAARAKSKTRHERGTLPGGGGFGGL